MESQTGGQFQGFEDIRHDMGWTYQVDIVAAPCLKGEHYLSQFFTVYGIAFAQLADGVVLAEDAFEVTVGKKDGS